MPRGKSISIQKRSEIITLHNENYSVRQISEKVRIPKSSVNNIIRQFAESGSLEDRNRPGSSRKTTHADDERLKLISKRNRRLTAPEILADFNRDRNNPVSISTVKRRLQEVGLHGRVAVKKPLLRRTSSLGTSAPRMDN